MSAPTTTSTSETTGSKLDGVGGQVGERAKGLFGAIHGAGEAIRGTINSGLDGLGDGVAGRKTGEVTSQSSTGSNEGVAQSGVAEAKAGYASLVGGPKGSTTSTSPHLAMTSNVTDLPPPPHHAPVLPPRPTSPLTTSTTSTTPLTHATPATSTSAAHETTGSKLGGVGGEVGDRVRGLFGAIHGAGEAIRGTINASLDGLGDGIAGRKSGEVVSHSSKGPSEEVARSGVEEAKAGYASLLESYTSVGSIRGSNCGPRCLIGMGVTVVGSAVAGVAFAYQRPHQYSNHITKSANIMNPNATGPKSGPCTMLCQ
ncbi:hypothetical protein RQP46_005236 [Phenoliferia psychrophenolica]